MIVSISVFENRLVECRFSSMAFVESIPAVLRILTVFGVVLLAMRFRFSLGMALLLGSLLLGLMFGRNPAEIVQAAWQALLDPKTLSLAAVVMLILVLSRSLESAGQMKRLLDNFAGLIVRPAVNLIVFPALIGLLPMPGGAIFSAPMVKDLGKRHRMNGAQLSFTNYWFRHIWEYWWPLYPGVLLTVSIAGLNLWSFVLLLFPLTPVAVAAGMWPLKTALNNGESGSVADTGLATDSNLFLFLKELTPIGIVIGLGLGLGIVFSTAAPNFGIAKESGLIVALGLAIAWVWRKNRLEPARIRKLVFSPKLASMFVMVVSILIFKGVLEDSQAVEAVSRELVRWHIPLVPVTIVMPFLVGTVSGITIAFVGTTFPVLISLVQNLHSDPYLLPYLMLALVGGFIGVLLSPVHLCLLLSNEYFQTTLPAVYRQLWAPCLALLLCGVLYFWVILAFI
jgi:hypothetical protein